MPTPSEEYILNAIRKWVWSGFYGTVECQDMIDDILEQDADAAMLRAAVVDEFAKKRAEAKNWPERTDCDRLDRAFANLNSAGVIALHNAGYTMSDGIGDVGEALHERGGTDIKGYCFYHGQDVERALDDGGLTLAFGDLDDDPAKKADVGMLVKQLLETEGFEVDWNGDPETRLTIPGFDWKRR